MKFIKITLTLLLLLFGSYSAIWFYIANQLTQRVNDDYADKSFSFHDHRGQEFRIKFKQAVCSGFPFSMGIRLEEMQEETVGSEIYYQKPLFVGYNFLKQQIVLSYSGSVLAYFKPAANKFGANLDVGEIFLKIDAPLSREFIQTVKEDNAQIVNYLRNIHIGSSNVKIRNIFDNKLVYHKPNESLFIAFEKAFWHKNFEEFISTLPKFASIEYQIETKETPDITGKIPASLFSGLYIYPSGMQANLNIDFTAKHDPETGKPAAYKINAKANLDSKLVKISNLHAVYDNENIQNHKKIKGDSQIEFELKKGSGAAIFAEIVKSMHSKNKKFSNNIITQTIRSEIEDLLKKEQTLDLSTLEGNKYVFILDGLGDIAQDKQTYQIKKLSVASADSEIQLQQTINWFNDINKTNTNGTVLLRNYEEVIKFLANIWYNIGSYKNSSDHHRDIYINTGVRFLKRISDYPSSDSKDISLEFDFDFSDLKNSRIGNYRITDIQSLYDSTLIEKVINIVGADGDVRKKILQHLPKEDLNIEMLDKILPKLEKSNSVGQNKNILDVTSQIIKKLPKGDKQVMNEKEVPKPVPLKAWENLLLP